MPQGLSHVFPSHPTLPSTPEAVQSPKRLCVATRRRAAGSTHEQAMRGNYYTGAPATAQQSQPRLQQMSSEPSANVGGPSRPCFRSVPAHRIVGGGLGRRYDHAARLSEYSLTSINEYLYHASSDVGDSSTRTDSGAGGGGRIGRVPVRLSRRDYFNNNNNDSYTSREGNRAEGDDDRLPNAGGDVVALEAPPPALVAAQPALEAARARRQAEVMRTRGGGEGEPPPPPPALEIPGGIGLELEIGAGCGGEGADGGRRAEGATLASLCLEAMAKSWESHSAVYLPRAYHMPHELCARLLRLLVSTRKLTAFSLSGEPCLCGCLSVNVCQRRVPTKCNDSDDIGRRY